MTIDRDRAAAGRRHGSWRRRAALPLLVLAAAACGGVEPPPPGFVVVMIDTLRADHLGAYGYDGPVSPNLDRFASEAVLFERCFAQAPWTKPSVATLFTSLYPQVHRLTNHEGKYWGPESPQFVTGILPDRAVTLAEVLHQAGYQTAGFVSNPWVSSAYGFAQGFEIYDDRGASISTAAVTVIDRARDWLATADSERPVFLYLHFMDVHAPYDSPRADFDALIDGEPSAHARQLNEREVPWVRWRNIEVRPEWADDELRHELSYWRARYAAGVRTLDRQLGRLLDELSQAGLLDRSWVVVTSDHGEELFEHGDWSHGQNLYEHQLRVPLLVRPPGGANGGRRVSRIVELADLMPTLLSLARVELPEGIQGRDVSALLRGEETAVGGASFATATERAPGLYAVRTERYKLIFDVDTDRLWLFDLIQDPTEQRDISQSEPVVAAELRDRLVQHIAESTAAGTLDAEQAELPDEVLERLRALGYLK